MELPVRRLPPIKCKSESNYLENGADIVLDGYVEETVVEFSIYDPGFASSNERPINLDEIIDKIPCRANTARDFVF